LENNTEMLKGLLEGCVIELIGRGETYGYEITQNLRDTGFSEVVEGTVYAILVRLERSGFVSSKKKPSAIGPARKFYTLTDSGSKERHSFWDKWNEIVTSINTLKEK
jgi:PadR family transcriptional regulator, regulatory protein PadR